MTDDVAASPAFRPRARFEGFPPANVAMVAVVVAVAGAAVIGFARQYGVTGEDLLRDPAATFEYAPHYGLFSSLGIGLLWATAAGTWIGSAARGPDRPALLTVGALSMMLALDDQFLLHEYYAPQIVPYGEYVLYAFYAACGIALVAHYRRRILQAAHVALPLSLFCLGFSILLDLIGGGPQIEDVVEDMSKLLGLVLWALYWGGMARHEVRQAAAGARWAQARPQRMP